MVSRYLLLWSLLLPALTLASSLRIATDGTEVEMGKVLSLDIIYVGNADPGLVDLQQWQDRFFIERQPLQREQLVSGEITTTERIHLFPRLPGEQVLDAIALGGAFAKPVRIQVKPAIRDGVDATPHWLPLPTQVWRGEVINIGAVVTLLDPGNEISMQELVLPGFVVEPLNNETRTVSGNTVVTLRWRLIPRWKGFYELHLPAIVQRGRGRWKFYLPSQQLQVMPLPGYLPPTLTVGDLSLQASVLNLQGRSTWQLSLANTGSLAQEVYGVRAAMADIAGISPDEVYRPNASDAVYVVTVPSWSWGWGQGPEISLRYFDTGTGMLKTAQTHFPAVWNVPWAMQIILFIAGVLLVGWLTLIVYKWMRHYLAARQYQHLLASADNPHALRRYLLRADNDLTLGAWASHRSGTAMQVADELNALCFSPAASQSFDETKLAAMRQA